MSEIEKRSSRIFDSYAEFVRLTRILSPSQLSSVRESLCDEEMNHLKRSRDAGGFAQLEEANEFDDCIKHIESITKFNPINIRLQLLNGRRVSVPSEVWNSIISELGQADSVFSAILMDGIVCRRDARRSEYVILTLGGRSS
jgi:hypothetical protein